MSVTLCDQGPGSTRVVSAEQCERSGLAQGDVLHTQHAAVVIGCTGKGGSCMAGQQLKQQQQPPRTAVQEASAAGWYHI